MKRITWKSVFESVIPLMVCTLALVSAALAAPVSINLPYHFRTQRSLNTVNYSPGVRVEFWGAKGGSCNVHDRDGNPRK